MSLDDYINASGIVRHSREKNRQNKRQNSSNSEYENEMVHQSNDNEEFIPKASSMQWRFKNPSRPLPTLVPNKALIKQFYNGNNFNSNQRRQCGNWYDRDAPSSHLHGINRNKQPNLKLQNRQNYNMLKDVAQKEIVSGVPLDGIMMNRISSDLLPFNQQSQTLAALATIGSQIYTSPVGYMDIAKIFIEKMAEIQQSRVNESKYDMSIQKDISNIQGKPFYYSCNGGPQKVIRFDGLGIIAKSVFIPLT